MKKAQFIQTAIEEIDHIIKVATDKEKGRLDFRHFNRSHNERCIYGQMTGDCASDRAKEIMPKIYKTISYGNGWAFGMQDFTRGERFTPLEKYLFMVNPDTQLQIIQYIKGEIGTLRLI
ncbi:hypothetical protein LCGC14_0370410 [marine sediment metagenome]|uniref:Uncharacterized protein n=1 Tax=marine sediment metagenome TaxID=412755 RepID=A0A0F9T579_9ZZZZ|nr:hypothetical protein [Maribacter sp.]HDZ04880.1 hypothetical protein [Maribacter sp.]